MHYTGCPNIPDSLNSIREGRVKLVRRCQFMWSGQLILIRVTIKSEILNS